MYIIKAYYVYSEKEGLFFIPVSDELGTGIKEMH
jgi:hypothetical protein